MSEWCCFILNYRGEKEIGHTNNVFVMTNTDSSQHFLIIIKKQWDFSYWKNWKLLAFYFTHDEDFKFKLDSSV